MSAFWSGNGGSIVCTGEFGTITLNIGKWTLRKGTRNVDNTHSGTSSTNYENVVPDNSGTLEIPWDSENIPDSDVGLINGAKVTLVLNLGKSGLSHLLSNTLIEFNEDTNDNGQDIIRTQCSFKGGVLTPAV